MSQYKDDPIQRCFNTKMFQYKDISILRTSQTRALYPLGCSFESDSILNFFVNLMKYLKVCFCPWREYF